MTASSDICRWYVLTSFVQYQYGHSEQSGLLPRLLTELDIVAASEKDNEANGVVTKERAESPPVQVGVVDNGQEHCRPV